MYKHASNGAILQIFKFTGFSFIEVLSIQTTYYTYSCFLSNSGIHFSFSEDIISQPRYDTLRIFRHGQKRLFTLAHIFLFHRANQFIYNFVLRKPGEPSDVRLMRMNVLTMMMLLLPPLPLLKRAINLSTPTSPHESLFLLRIAFAAELPAGHVILRIRLITNTLCTHAHSGG